jgi:hypothetical protein
MSIRYEMGTPAAGGKAYRRFRGSFTPSGAGVSSASGANRGTNFTPSHSGTTGIYRVTLTNDLGETLPFLRLVKAIVSYQQLNADTAPTFAVVGTVVEASGTVDIIVWAEGAGTLAKANVTASGVARRINFDFEIAIDDIPGDGASA